MNKVALDPWQRWLQSRARRTLTFPQYRQAAVLVGLTSQADPNVLLTVRAADLPTHQGQISFPGGGLEAGETPLEAALREAWEEVGLHSSAVDVLGALDDAWTPLGFHVTPFLARIPPFYPYRASAEVAQILLPSLGELRALTPLTERRKLPEGGEQLMYRYPWRGHDIWGMTARILHDVVQSGVE